MPRNVFITGGTGDVGASLVRRFLSEGDRVFGQYRSTNPATVFGADAAEVSWHQIDFSKPFTPPDLEIDILINNAAINISKSKIFDSPMPEFYTTLEVNLIAPIRLAKAYLPEMRKRGFGRVINISSIYGIRGSDENSSYVVAKHGLSGLTKSIAKDCGEYGITCNEICPGPIKSKLLERIARDEGATSPELQKEYFTEMAARIPTKKLANVSDVSNVAFSLSLPSSGYINGASIVVDGGLIC